MATLTLVRHAQASLFAADYDVLSDKGREQAELLGARWRAENIRFDRVITGPARRHRDTARIALGPDVPANVIDGFDEHDAFTMVKTVAPRLVGRDPIMAELVRAAGEPGEPTKRSASWQNVFEAVMERWLRADPDTQVDGVESWEQFGTRVAAAFRSVLESQHRAAANHVLVVTSVGPTAVILRDVFGCSPLTAFSTAWRQANASISRFMHSPRRRDGMLSLDTFNDTLHLHEADLVTHR